nr:MAG TPA: hypothetical protein [Caudoviricetes sp.]
MRDGTRRPSIFLPCFHPKRKIISQNINYFR